MRAILLGEICKRIDIIDYLNQHMGLGLKATKKLVIIYKGRCPNCGKKTFFCHRRTGYSICMTCENCADFFDLAAIKNNCTPDKAMEILSEYLKQKAGGSTSAGDEA